LRQLFISIVRWISTVELIIGCAGRSSGVCKYGLLTDLKRRNVKMNKQTHV